jgi:hypothetical protein
MEVRKGWSKFLLTSACLLASYAIIPLDLAGLLAHNLFHILTEGKAVWFNTACLFGTYLSGDLSLVSLSTVQIMQYVIIFIGTIGSIYTAYWIGKRQSFVKLLPYYSMMILLAVINIYLFMLPMAHRM